MVRKQRFSTLKFLPCQFPRKKMETDQWQKNMVRNIPYICPFHITSGKKKKIKKENKKSSN